MNIKELKEILDNYDDKTNIIMSKDGEGNAFSPLAGYGDGLYVADSTWSGDIYNKDERDEAGDDAEAVIVLWPTN